LRNILTIDVEETFQVSEFRVPPSDWDLLPSRVQGQTEAVLELLGRYETKATFFILGWVAERHPQLVRRIASAGHEIGCHSYAHRLIYELGRQEFKEDTQRSVRAIEDAASITPRCYRAPSYSIVKSSLWALEVLVECGFTHDSSIYPIAHDRYGIPGFSRHAQSINTASGAIWEVPVATVELSGKHIPVGGGGYLRLLPYRYTAAGIRRINGHDGRPACIYFHPWEIDAKQPRMAGPLASRLRTYAGIGSMASKLDRLLSEFSFGTVTSVFPGASASPLFQEDADSQGLEAGRGLAGPNLQACPFPAVGRCDCGRTLPRAASAAPSRW
jgi:polysaccharide deacetylase family protein (PEP-CTERM system associated)